MNQQALENKLKHIAKENNLTFHQVWKQLIMERLLVRLSQSPFADKFIFKGGILLSRYLEIGRETKDLDFLAQFLDSKKAKMALAFKNICAIDPKDGFQFSLLNISPHGQVHMDYPGFQLKLKVAFEKIKDSIQIDIGVGDAVRPQSKSFKLYHYCGRPVFEKNISLQVYPLETIFAEKFETLISRGAANSRMKDYHDLVLLCRKSKLLHPEKLNQNIKTTFDNRNTPIGFPIIFSQEEYSVLQKLWGEHIKKLGPLATGLNLPIQIESVVNELNEYLESIAIVPT